MPDNDIQKFIEDAIIANTIGHPSRWDLLKRWVRNRWQKIRYGFNDRDLWNLNSRIMRFTLPRLKRFRAMDRSGYPAKIDADGKKGMEVWNAMLDDMIFAFEVDLDPECELQENEQYIRGHSHFGVYWMSLWD